MGTRHMQTVIDKEGNLKIQQYGQWDGYPSGQGIDILNYLRRGDLEKYQKNLSKLKILTEKQLKKISKRPWLVNYPHLNRNCGAKLHKMVEDGEVKSVYHFDDSDCEGFYTIDFSKNEFTSKFHRIKVTYPLDKLPTDEQYLKDMKQTKKKI